MEPINQKIAITGLGIVGPFGLTRESLWEAQTATGVSFQSCSRYIGGLPSAEGPPINLLRVKVRVTSQSGTVAIGDLSLATQPNRTAV